MEHLLEVNNLTKTFSGYTAVNGVNFKVPKGSVFGILGPNGSGKTTLLNMLLTLITPDSGTFQLMKNENPDEARSKMGVSLESAFFHLKYSGIKNLEMFSTVKNHPAVEIDRALQTVELSEHRNKQVGKYSMGMKQRLSIAQALMGSPDLLILDEPTNGLDPHGIIWVRKLISQYKEAGKTVLLASHLLDEMQKVCTHILLLNKGNTLFCGTLDEILKGHDSLEEVFLSLTEKPNVL